MELTDKNGTTYSGIPIPSWSVPIAPNMPPTVYPATCCMYFTKIEDTNGNYLMHNYTTSYSNGETNYVFTGWTDTLGRTFPDIPSYTDPYPDTYMPGLPGQSWSSQTILPGPNGGTTQYTSGYATEIFSFPESGHLAPLSPCLAFASVLCGTPGYFDVVLESVTLPDGSAWNFSYDHEYGTLSQITLPTGGTISYTWTSSTACTGPYVYIDAYYPTYAFAVTSRTVNANDGTGPHTWYYRYGYPNSNQTTVTDPLGNDTVHTMTPLGAACVNVYETESDKYAGSYSPGNLLEKTVTSYEATPDPYVLANYSGLNYSGGLGGTVMNVVPTSVTTTDIASGKTSQITKSYDSGIELSMGGDTPLPVNAIYGDVTQENEYDYGNGAPGPLLRTTNTTYMALNGPNSAQYLANNLLSIPYTVQVLNSSGVQASFAQYNYDETTPIASGLAAAQELDTAPPAGAYRGNNTSVLRWLNSGSLTCPNGKSGGSGSNVISKNTYFNTGTVNTVSDPCGDTTTYAYSPTYNDAFPTTVTNALGQSSSFGFDFNTGLKTSATDLNNQTTSYGYDSLWRLASVHHPDGGTLTYCHSVTSTSECPGAISSPSVLLTEMLNANQSEQFEADVDGLGRKVKDRVLSDLSGVDMVDTTYDAAGRVQSVSNPYRTTGDSTYGITTYLYDALNRKTYEYHADGSYLQWIYSGNVVTSQDEMGNQWQRTSDALGRLTKVLEPNGVSAPASMETDYTYDALGNLLTVAQKGAVGTDTPLPTRTFTYDSLSRLVTAFNLESGAESYTYDPIGNVTSKTSPLVNATSGMQTMGYCYDGLNRMTYKFYSAPPSNCTSSSGYAASYTYDASTISGATNVVGKLTDEKAYLNGTLISERSPNQYDPMGRLKGEQQIPYSPAATAYQLLYDYDLAGNVTCASNGFSVTGSSSDCASNFTPVAGSSIVEQYAYDSVGRLEQASTSTLPANFITSSTISYPSVLFQASGVNTPSYDPMGHLVNAQLALIPAAQEAGISITRQYDNRGRLISEVDGGSKVSNSTGSIGYVTVSGAESGPFTVPATAGTGVLTVSGADGTHQVCTASPVHPIAGKPVPPPVCTMVADTGTLSVTVNGFTSSAGYASGTTDAALASTLAAEFSASGSPVTATASGPA